MTTNLKALKQLLRTINHAMTQPKVRSDRIEVVCSVSEFCNLFEIFVWSTLLIIFWYAWLIVCLLGCLIAWLIVLWGCLIALRLIVFIGCPLSYKVDRHYWLSLRKVHWTISMVSLDYGFGNCIQCCQFHGQKKTLKLSNKLL